MLNNLNALPAEQILHLANQLKHAGKLQQALRLYQNVQAREPANAEAALQMARMLHQAGNLPAARAALEHAFNHGADAYPLLHMLAALQHSMGDYKRAEKTINQALSEQPKATDTLNLAGTNLVEQHRFEEAIGRFEQVIKLNPKSVDAHNNIAWVLRSIGDKNRAIEHFEKAIKLDPKATEALSGLLLLKKYQDKTSDFTKAEKLLAAGGLSDKQQLELEFALGKAYEDIQEYHLAFNHFKTGNRKWREATPYDYDNDVKLFDQLKSTFNKPLGKIKKTGINKPITPVFILGMPRSSTSLVEQILASHSSITGAGELTYLGELLLDSRGLLKWNPETQQKAVHSYLNELFNHSEQRPFVCDKMPQNFRFIGAILELFPNAKIIHCKRHPLDTCLSLYKHHFPASNHPYAYDLESLGRYYLLYDELMQHWSKLAGDAIYHLSYEALLGDFEGELKKLFNYLELELEPSCLNFHETKRVVRTASSEQVRQGLYQSGAAQWKHYEEELSPLIDVLKPILPETD